MSYTRSTTVDPAPGGDTVKSAVVDLDTDLTGIFADLNTHEAATTGIHGFTGTKTGSGAMVGAESPTFTGTPAVPTAEAGTSTTQVASTAFVQAAFSGRKNYIINGNFDIWQRGTNQTATGYGSDDRWSNSNLGSSKVHSQQAFTLGQTDVPGEPKYFSRTVVTSVAGAANFVDKIQYIEGARTLASKEVTLSFWAKADASKNIAIDFLMQMGTGGSPSAAVYYSPTTCALTAAWQKFTVTANVPSLAGKTLGTNGGDCIGVVFWFDAGSSFNARTNTLGQQSGTFDIAQVQLEEGPVATEFELRHSAVELTLCQRYYEAGDFAVTTYGASTQSFLWPFATQKRVSPTITSSGWTYTNCSGGSAGSSTTKRLVVGVTVTAPGNVAFSTQWFADAEL